MDCSYDLIIEMSSITRRTVATAVAGDLAKFLFEELISDGHFDVVIISQAVIMLCSGKVH